MNDRPVSARSGLPAAIGAYLIWGFLPLYLILVSSVPSVEFVAWRIVWTLPLCMAIVLLRGQWGEVLATLRSPSALATLAASAALIGTNWLIYIWAVNAGEIFAASLGYYINPLINVLLGTVLLGEKLTRRQWAAVAIASAGVAMLLGGALTTLWISLSLALSFGSYGMLRKRVAVGALPGLTIESAILIVPAAATIAWYAASPQGTAFGHDLRLSALIVFGGVLTAIPLWLFAVAARRMDLSTLGFVQFLSPTIVFVLGLTVFDRPLHPAEIAAFGTIWVAVAVFVWDLVARRRSAS